MKLKPTNEDDGWGEEPNGTSKVPMPGPMPPLPPEPPVTGQGEILVSFESGHYKKVKGSWKGDSVWCHINKNAGGMVHINKDKVEYIETFE